MYDTVETGDAESECDAEGGDDKIGDGYAIFVGTTLAEMMSCGGASMGAAAVTTAIMGIGVASMGAGIADTTSE